MSSEEPGSGTLAALVSPGARRLRIAALLMVDAALLGAGGTFIGRYVMSPPQAAAQTLTQTQTLTETQTPTETQTQTPTRPLPPTRTIPKEDPAKPPVVVHHTHNHPARLRPVSVPKPKPRPTSQDEPRPIADPTPLPPPPPTNQPPPAREEGEAPAGSPGSGGAVPSPAPPSAEIEEDNVRFVVQHHLPQVQSCYERALKQDARLEGVIELQFTLQPDGSATGAHSVANSTGNEGLATCLAHLLESWQFPRPADGPLEFVYPFAFAGGS